MSVQLVEKLGGVSGNRPKVAVVGGGISGLTAAYKLRNDAEVTLFEANDYIGGHTNTIDVQLEGIQYPVDTGFLVFNERTYPNLIALFKELDVETALSDMSFAVTLPEINLEWAGTNLNTVFAQRRNLFRPTFLLMLKDILRFNKQTTEMALRQAANPDSNQADMLVPLGQFLKDNGYNKYFKDWYLLPMAAAIWSCPSEEMLAFPVATFVRFCHNHGLLQVENRPRWFTVKGGARNYVEKILPHIPHVFKSTPITRVDTSGNQPVVHTAQAAMTFDAVIMACHSDQSYQILSDNQVQQRALLKNIRYQDNVAFLHTDTCLLPKRSSIWSSWNYLSDVTNPQPSVSVTYLLNMLQPRPFKTPVMVTLNPIVQPNPERVIREIHYSHPIFDGPAIEAQLNLPRVQGENHVYLAGAWAGYGFHEDGHKAGLAAAQAVQTALKAQTAAVA